MKPATTRWYRCGACGVANVRPNGEYLRYLRAEAGLSLREVARRLGYSPSFISDIERNQRLARPAFLAAFKRAIR